MAQLFDVAHTLQQALALHQQGRLAEAEPLYLKVLKVQPGQSDALHYFGVLKLQQGRFDEAAALIADALRVRPNAPDALSNRGIALQSLGRYEEAVVSYDRAIAQKPGYTDALFNRGNALHALGRYAEALASFDRAVATQPDFAPALSNRGNTLQLLDRHEDAIASYDRALALRGDNADVLNNRGNAARALKRSDEAIADYRRALAILPDYPEALNNLGNALADRQSHAEAITCYHRALAIRPDYPDASMNLGNAMAATGHRAEAIACYERVLALQPDRADAYYARGGLLHTLGRYEEAIADYDRALAFRPGHANTLHSRGNALTEMDRHDEALASYEKALAVDADVKYLLGDLAHARASLCDWKDHDAIARRMREGVRAGKPVASPFVFLTQDDPALQLACASACVRDKFQAAANPLRRGEPYAHDRIRVAYLSADLHNHATAYLMAELFERHDRARFETSALSFGPDRPSEMRSRLVAAFDRFVDVRLMSDIDVAKLVRELEIDIAVDLKGYTENARPGILAHRPAPVQVNYLGYPGTMGASYIDYIIADDFVIPRADALWYSEKIVWLPGSYQVNDTRRTIAERTPTRSEVGLPESGFVFCCFNNNYKLTPAFFDIWTRLLRRVPGSVLWLLRTNDEVERNLRREAEARGVDPERLVFARRLPLADHLARQRLADLFVDTLPINAHTTASDALWVGLPVLTCAGRAFAARVAGSLLGAVGLLDMITLDLREYEDRAVQLATQPALLAEIRERLSHNRLNAPLFDVERFRRHLEAAYTTMWQACLRGDGPTSFAVEAIVP
jgi:protein O-GlcNAc transferase